LLNEMGAMSGSSSQEANRIYNEPALPTPPPGVDIVFNVWVAMLLFPNPGPFYHLVETGGTWDYKSRFGKAYEDFGNFHYGLVGKAWGFTDFMLFNEAGINQSQGRNANPERWGAPASRWSYLIPSASGKYPYGDDPWDRYWIGRGIRHFREGHGFGK